MAQEKQRLDKVIGNSGFGTRKEIKNWVRKGLITVNGIVATSSDMKVNPEEDVITVMGETLEYQQYIYLMMHKPAGYITATEDRRQATVYDLLPEFYQQFDLSPVGRLDKDTEGLLLLTNDGANVHKWLAPKSHVEKTYFAKLEKPTKPTDFEAIQQGVDIGGYVTMPAELQQGDRPDEILLTIHEGKFHQVKRMFEALDNKVLYLKRISMGGVALDETLQKGEVRELTTAELRKLLDTDKPGRDTL